MKRLALLTITAFLALVLSACGENAGKKADTSTTTTTTTQQPAQPASDTGTPADNTKTGQ